VIVPAKVELPALLRVAAVCFAGLLPFAEKAAAAGPQLAQRFS
jgi:hypothetical protein